VIKIVLLVLLSEIFTAVGQILYKKSTNALESYSLRGVGAQFRFLGDVFARPSIWLGFLFMAIGLAVWLIALAEGDLSLVFPIGSLQYVLILFSAHFFLGERIDWKKAIGTFLVVAGIILITMS
jgi:drug/metabolite transporter (DMT)-like permease